jgi:arginine decarboxylase
MKQDALTRWTAENSAELYGIRNWGAGYFDVSPGGEVIVRPNGPKSTTEVSLTHLIDECHGRGLNMPVLIRFSNILASRIEEINESFRKAIAEAGYQGEYRGVFPIKVNQQREVVADIIEAGRKYHHGIEAGSKAELLVATTMMRDPDAFVVCNGYKDEEFIDTALHAVKMGFKTVLVIEMPSELDLIIERSKKLKIRPILGVRAKLSSRAGGHWDSSGGDRSKFGLDASQIIELVDELRKKGMLDCLQMLHYHLGSQVSDIRKVRTALQEACRFYVELAREGAAMGILNLGGGLAVDYDGSHTNFECSTNYSPPEYASDVVEVIMKTLDSCGVKHPTIVSESGRATVAHHAVLVFNVLHVRRFEPLEIPDRLPPNASEMLGNMKEVCDSLSPRNVQEAYHDAVYYRDELRTMFLHGTISLRERALAESLFWRAICRIYTMTKGRKYIPDELEGLEPVIADVYYGNFSVFQSIPDFWAIDQLFPIMPIHRLNQRPTRNAVLADITCDSDGKVDKFIDLHDVKQVLPLHAWDGREYYLGIFLVGAYQETIGDMHNLLGNTNVLHVWIDDKGRVEWARQTTGDRVDEILQYMEYNPKDMVSQMKARIDKAAKAKQITPKEKSTYLKAYKLGMKGYTYFEQ